MPTSLSGSEVVARASALRTYWGTRTKKMKTWYEQLQMVDSLAQTNMESFVGNSPRVSFNSLAGILNQRIPHKLPAADLSLEQVQPAAELSRMFELIWNNVEESYRQRGRCCLKDLIDFLLATGWYSVYANISMDGSACIAEVWNPTTVFPYYDDVMTECAHIFSPGEAAVTRMAQRNGWKIQKGRATIFDYWWVETTLTANVIHNAIVVGNELVKPDTVESRFTRIPIFCSPVAGLPDAGDIIGKDDWKGEIGQSFLATNENVYKSSNKWWTFLMQLLRDTAQPRTYEKTNSSTNLIKPESWYRRGAHFKLGLQDEVGFITPPPIPVELRSTQLDIEAMEQRGGTVAPTDIRGQLTNYAMAQMSANTNMIARFFHQGLIDCLSDIDNFWLGLIKDNNYKPYDMSLPAAIPEAAKLTASYELRVPGDLVQRATTARMLNPTFELSDERIIEELFPEISSPTYELAKVRASKARKEPIYAQLSLIEALRQESILMANSQDSQGADLYEKAAARFEQQIIGQLQPQQPQGQPPQQAQPGIPPEVLPPNQP